MRLGGSDICCGVGPREGWKREVYMSMKDSYVEMVFSLIKNLYLEVPSNSVICGTKYMLLTCMSISSYIFNYYQTSKCIVD